MVISWGMPSSTREGIQSHQDSFPHYLQLHIENGKLELHTSLPEFKGSVFTSGFGNWLARTIGVNITNSPLFAEDLKYEQKIQWQELSSPSSKRPRRDNHSTKPEESDSVEMPTLMIENKEMIPLEIGDEKMVEAYYESAFRAFQQINCRQIAKAYIKLIEPRKQVKHPYKGRQGALGKEDPEKTKPDWWPAGVVHREPDHLKMPERIRLLVHIFRKLGKSRGITADQLEEAGRDVQRQIKPSERLDILNEIYKVRRAEECYERGEADANAVVFIIDRDEKAKKDLQEIDSAIGAAHDPMHRPTVHTQEREIETWNIGCQIPTEHARPRFAIHSTSERRDYEEQYSQFLPYMGIDYPPPLPSVGTTGWLPASEPTDLERLELYSSNKAADGIDQDRFPTLPSGHSCTTWIPHSPASEYVPQGYTQWSNGLIDDIC